MAVSSFMGCLSKLSARIRDYIDHVDSYQRPGEDHLDSAVDRVSGDELSHPSHHYNQHYNHQHHHAHSATSDHKSSKHSRKADKRGLICNKSDNHRHPHHDSDCSSYHRTIRQLALHERQQQQQQLQQQQQQQQQQQIQQQQLHQPRIQSSTSTPSARSASALGYTKRKTSQGQVYFVDQRGHKFWHDPSVPKEILNANLDLEQLVGPLPSNWEVSRTTTGKVYYINHTKKSTQFTDPRLIMYKDFLVSYLRHHPSALATAVAQELPITNDLTAQPAIDFRPVRAARQPLSLSNSNSQDQRDSSRTASRVAEPPVHSSGHRRHSGLMGNLNNSVIDVSVALHNSSLAATNEHRNEDNSHLDNLVIGGTLNGRRNMGRHSLLMGSVQNLSNNPGGAGNSNTLTGPPPRWFADYPELVAPTLSNLRKQVAKNNRLSATNNNQTPRSATNNLSNTVTNVVVSERTSSQRNSTNPAVNSLIDSQNNCQAHSSPTCLPPSYEPHLGNPDINKRELYDKISLLRQELLKQQVLSHPCRIDISRKRIFEESFRAVTQLQPRDLKKRLLIKFRGEEGLDYGGVAREWFYLLSREILNPVHGLFQYTGDDNYNLQINPDSGIVYREHLAYMNFCGRIIGMAVFHGHFIEGRFTLPFYKMLLGKPIFLPDIEFVDPDLHRSLCWILDNDITDVIDTTFLVQHNAFGELQEHELKLGGRSIQVTEANKHEYVTLYVNYRCRRGIESQFSALQRGFYELIQPHLVDSFDEHELELLIGGLSKINIDDWRVHTKLKNCTTETSLVRWFWDIVKTYDEDKRARLLQFVTGSPRVPIQGFKALQGVNSELRLFTIHLIRNGNTDNLPKSHTCFNRIDLPPYETYDKLRDKLTQAIEETMGFAMQ